MRKLASPLRYQIFAIVTARGPHGILDNMRYDRACPWEEHDANLLERFLTNAEYDSVVFIITKWVEDKRSEGFAWTHARWGDGVVVPCSSERAYHVERQIYRRPVRKPEGAANG